MVKNKKTSGKTITGSVQVLCTLSPLLNWHGPSEAWVELREVAASNVTTLRAFASAEIAACLEDGFVASTDKFRLLVVSDTVPFSAIMKKSFDVRMTSERVKAAKKKRVRKTGKKKSKKKSVEKEGGLAWG